MIVHTLTRGVAIGVCIAAGALVLKPAQAAEGFSLEAKAGIQYDSNIAVPALDLLADDKDAAAVFRITGEYEAALGSDTSLTIGYTGRQSLHFERDDFDIQSHGLKALIKHDFGAFKLGFDYRYYFTRLGGEDFMHLHRLSPNASFYLTENVYVRAAYTYTDKNIIGSVARDATVHAFGSDVYFFMNRKKSYFLAGYRFENQDAVGPEFDFDAHILKARYSTRFDLFGSANKIRLGWEYETRNYDNITPSIGEIRDDDRHTLRAEWEVPVTETIFAEFEYRYRDYSSNLASADYSESRITAEIGVRF